MAASTDPAVTVFAWGNESRGDDAIGTILAGRIKALDHPAINIVEDHQLNIEPAMDIENRVPVLFIDASVAIERDFALERLAPVRDASISTHSISPEALLDLYQQTLKSEAPDAYMLHVRGDSFELGEAISDSSKRSVDSAWQFLEGVFAGSPENWGRRLQAASGAPAAG